MKDQKAIRRRGSASTDDYSTDEVTGDASTDAILTRHVTTSQPLQNPSFPPHDSDRSGWFTADESCCPMTSQSEGSDFSSALSSSASTIHETVVDARYIAPRTCETTSNDQQQQQQQKPPKLQSNVSVHCIENMRSHNDVDWVPRYFGSTHSLIALRGTPVAVTRAQPPYREDDSFVEPVRGNYARNPSSEDGSSDEHASAARVPWFCNPAHHTCSKKQSYISVSELHEYSMCSIRFVGPPM